MLVESKIAINETRARVWKVITDIHNAEKIISGVEKIEILNEPLHGLVGLKWRETRMYFGKPSAIDKWITNAIENTFYKTSAAMDGFIFITTMTISDNGDNILLTSTHETKSNGIIAQLKSLPMIFFKGMLKKAIMKDLHDIKITAEHK